MMTKKGFALELVEPISQSFAELWDDSTGDHTEKLLKSLLVEFLCRMQEARCLEKAGDFFYSVPGEYFDTPNDPRYNNT